MEPYRSLIERNASERMLEIFSEENQHRIFRRIWVALAEAEQAVGLDITDAQLAAMRAHVDSVDMDTVHAIEKKYGNMTIAGIEAFGKDAPEAAPIIHLGATTSDLTDNANLIQMRDASALLLAKLRQVAANLYTFTERYKDMPILGYTRLQAAQPVTVGKRAATWLQDIIYDAEAIQEQIDTLAFRGLKGATGTQASFYALLDENPEKVEELDRLFSEKLGFRKLVPITTQVYPRKIETRMAAAVAGIAESAQKMGHDIRVLACLKELEEPVGENQIGSSTMAYKRNPWIAEDLAAYSKYLITLLPALYQSSGQEMLEQTCDNLAVRMLAIADIFLTADVLCEKLLRMTSGITVYEKLIRRHLEEEMPFMATENIIMEAAKKGGDRQEIHHILKAMSMETVQRVRVEGLENDLLDRVAAHPAIPLSRKEIDAIVDPAKFVGMAPRQVEQFLERVAGPFLKRYGITPE